MLPAKFSLFESCIEKQNGNQLLSSVASSVRASYSERQTPFSWHPPTTLMPSVTSDAASRWYPKVTREKPIVFYVGFYMMEFTSEKAHSRCPFLLHRMIWRQAFVSLPSVCLSVNGMTISSYMSSLHFRHHPLPESLLVQSVPRSHQIQLPPGCSLSCYPTWFEGTHLHLLTS